MIKGTGRFIVLLCAGLVLSARPGLSHAQAVRYLYDDLGRLIRVIDESTGQAATYHYDPVGNMLSITRETVDELQPQVGGIDPDFGRAGISVGVTITGQNLLGAVVTTDNPGIVVTDSRATDATITATFVISAAARQGPATVSLDTGLGVRTAAFTVLPPAPVPTLSPRVLALTPGAQATLTVNLSNTDVLDTEVVLTLADSTVASLSTASLTIPAGERTAPLTVTAAAVGTTTLTAASEGGTAAASIFVTAPFVGSVMTRAIVSVSVGEEPPGAARAPGVSGAVLQGAGVVAAPLSVDVADQIPDAARARPVSVEVVQGSGALAAPVSVGVATQLPNTPSAAAAGVELENSGAVLTTMRPAE